MTEDLIGVDSDILTIIVLCSQHGKLSFTSPTVTCTYTCEEWLMFGDLSEAINSKV